LLSATTVTAEVLSSTLATFFAFIGNVALVFLFMFASTGELNTKVKKAYPAAVAETIDIAFTNIATQVRWYLILRILLSGVTGLIAVVVLWILSVEFPIFCGIFTFLLVFIPTRDRE